VRYRSVMFAVKPHADGASQFSLSRRGIRELRHQARELPGARPLLHLVLRVLRRSAGMPAIGETAERVLAGVRGVSGQPPMPVSDVLRILTALDAEGVRYWLGGGWGVEALLGFESREHSDLDLVLDDHESALPAVKRALATVGYVWRSTDQGAVWLPHRSTFEDTRGRHVEALGIDWYVLEAAWSLLRPTPAPPGAIPQQRKDRCFGTGVLAGRPVPCLSREAQLLFHSGYVPRSRDLADIRHLQALSSDAGAEHVMAAGETALLVPVFGLGGTIRDVWTEMNRGNGHMPPHVTLLYPFLPGDRITRDVIDRLTEICAEQEPFDFSLDRTGWFDKKVLYLSPMPSEPFVALCQRLMVAFPECEPYGGRFAETIPHLTISESGAVGSLLRAERRIRRDLPVSSTAERVFLMTLQPDRQWSIAASLRLGASAQKGSRRAS
jgi:2'-5' RNA ligase